MNLPKPLALTLALVTLAGLTSVGASAQTITKASFSLPAQAYWNSTLLPPGEYTLSLSKSRSGVTLIALHGNGIAATFLTPAGAEQISGRSLLKVDAMNGTYVIRELHTGPLGMSYRFGVAKAVRNRTLGG